MINYFATCFRKNEIKKYLKILSVMDIWIYLHNIFENVDQNENIIDSDMNIEIKIFLVNW
jgi:hypothetical protein